jgi:hypothetical protein
MDIKEIRRENLRKWVAQNGVPKKEKSLFSQLLGGSSFGERLARRLEEQYKMGAMFLDGESIGFGEGKDAPPVEAAEATRLLTLYWQSTKTGREQIMDSAEIAQKIATRGSRSASNDPQ